MKVIAVTNFYPPHVIGGYEALCEENVEYLRAQGHEVRVLTSTHGEMAPTRDGHVERILTLDSALEGYRPALVLRAPGIVRDNRRRLAESIRRFGPQVVLVWGMWNMNWAMLEPAEAGDSPPVAFYLASPWPMEPTSLAAYWGDRPRGRLRGFGKRCCGALLRWAVPDLWQPRPLTLRHAMSNTETLRRQLVDAGYDMGQAAIVCEGIDLDAYLPLPALDPNTADPLRAVFVGRLGRHKGPHTILEALDILVNERGRRDVRVTICGGGHPDYRDSLRQYVQDRSLSAYVEFMKPIPRAELPALLGRNHVLVLSSIWEEQLARIMQEAMAAGRVVVGTMTGATPEFVVDDETGLTFAPGDAVQLADRLALLADDRGLLARLAAAGRALARERFDIVRMNREIEGYLSRLVASTGSADAAGGSAAASAKPGGDRS